MRHQKELWSAAIAVAGCALSMTLVQAQTYSYTFGPNYVNMSGARCRAANSTSAVYVAPGVGKVTVSAAVGPQTVYCPITRRSTAYYKDVSGSQIDTSVRAEYIMLRGQDSYTQGSLSCFPFASGIGSGATFFGNTRYLCSTIDGCSSAPTASWTGTNTIYWGVPITAQSVQWGLSCSLPTSSSIYFYEAAMTAN